MAGSIAGVAAIVRGFETLLKSYLQAAIDEIEADLGLSYGLSAPDSTHGYTRSRQWPRDGAHAIRVVAVQVAERDELHCLGAPRREDATIEVTIQYAPTVGSDAEDHLDIYTQAIRRVILRYWRTLNPSACIQDVTSVAEPRSSSLRERFSDEGLFNFGGVELDSTVEQSSVFFGTTQAVYAPITFTA